MSNYLGSYDLAVDHIRRAIQLQPTFAEAHCNLGIVLKAQGILKEAATAFLSATAITPDLAQAQRELAGILQTQDLLDEAIARFRRTFELHPAIAELEFNLGIAFQRQRRLDHAVLCYRRALEWKPNLPEAHCNLGIALHNEGRRDEAVTCLKRALELNSNYAQAHNNLGYVFHEQGKLDDAVNAYQRAIELNPDFAEAHNNLGNALQELGKLDEAVTSYQQALHRHPDFAEAHCNLGGVLQVQGKLDEAIAEYGCALALKPDLPKAHNNLGYALQVQGKIDEAVASFRQALDLNPDFVEAHNNLGLVFGAQGKLDEAIASYEKALFLKPEYAEVHHNLGNVFNDQGKHNLAMGAFRRALELKPDYAEAHSNLGAAFYRSGQFDDALTCINRALELKPEYADAHYGRSMLRLLHGDFERGWPEHEWRWKTRPFSDREFPQPRWDGSPLHQRTILLHAEQGFGDSIQFIRYAALVKNQNAAATVVVECPASLRNLIAKCPGIDRVVAAGEDLPPFDVHSPLLSLPGIFKTNLETIPADVPYLFADPTLVAHWRERLKNLGGLRVGINWRGRHGQGEFRKRDIPLDYFVGLSHLPGITLVNLQKGAGRDELLKTVTQLPIFDLGDDVDTFQGAFIDTAAIMKNLDLVITSDTAIPHLAGALGVPVWLALPFVPDWRWLLDREDSPWYPTMRLFRQKSPGDWTGVFDEIRAELGSLIHGAR